jgi:hypothetical protein
MAITTAIVMIAGSVLQAAAPPPHPALARGLALMRDGDFEAAVLELDAATRTLEADPRAVAARPWAYVYLGVAYLELDQEGVARGKFREALTRDASLRLDPAQFSAQSIRVFEGVRAESAVVTRPRPVASPPPAEKRSKGPLVAVIVGGAAAAGAAIALAGGSDGGGGGATTTTTPGNGGTTTTTTATTTPATTPTTTLPPTTQPPTTQPPSTTPPQPTCRYDVAGQVNVPLAGCIGCSCSVSANPASCTWSARTSDGNMINITQGSGSGNGNVVFNVGPSLSPRTGRITLAEGGGTCTVSQGVLFAPAR